MTDQEKIEKLLNHLEVFGELYECDAHFANEERRDNRYDDDWCETIVNGIAHTRNVTDIIC